ncbi:ABC transporter ATP-binding protein YtrB [Sporotomaculum syntrophicum]|uniref:ABC transporter ATP-binding protein YtrB n=1 Tax=Sporotomaculum syntrophicum TaxID=182264 RepID=A0A9D2WM26_9FIRM|nr:ABC transporter ATP-binding protein [Sporotomaculum syntrophicum]KAF1083754.1 ABC transporter ATP-binding protein YtrB [Sporotomaculum syntrophicum]
MIDIQGVSKSYQRKTALNNATMKLEQGKIVGLLGPNGSGKTTLLRILVSELRADSGSVSIDGEKLSPALKAHISGLTTSDFMPAGMTIQEAADTYESFFNDFDMERFHQLLKEVDLSPDMKIGSLSKGMKSKYALALAISRKAKLIVLDEPLDGVDPVAREEILRLISSGFSQDSTLLVTSHLINELERLLDEVYFIRDGEIRYIGDVETIRAEKKMSLDELYREVYRR